MIAVIDYQSGNLRSISKALEEVGAKVKVTDSPPVLSRARGIVLPGVGAFHHGMKVIKKKGLISPILNSIQEGKPFLGICLGLQLLFTQSEEHGLYRGIGIIKGNVRRFPPGVRIPHLGWNQIKRTKRHSEYKILDGVGDNTYFYFVHSYYVVPEDKDIIVTETLYGKTFTSCIVKDNIWGVQFHPEKSSSAGLKILENFCQYAG